MMKFCEVTNRMNAPVRHPGDKADGLPLNVAIPHMAEVRVWQAIHGGYSWVISYEPGCPQWTDDQRTEYVGYTASYRRLDHHESSKTIKVDGGPWGTFAKAEMACKQVWRQIRRAN